MPRTKREGIFYGVIMAFNMSIFMNLFNTFLHAGISIESLKKGSTFIASDFRDCYDSRRCCNIKNRPKSSKAPRS